MRLRLILIGLLTLGILGPQVSDATPITIADRGQCTAGTSATVTKTSMTITNASPMIVSISWRGNVTISSVTWGAGLTVVDTSLDASKVAQTAVYKLLNPTPGTHDVVVTFSGAPVVASCFIIGTANGDTSTGFRTVYKRSSVDGVGPGITVVDSQLGDAVLHAATVFSSTITFDNGESTASTEDDGIVGSATSGGLSTKGALGASTVVGATDIASYSEIAFAMIGDGTVGIPQSGCAGSSPAWTAADPSQAEVMTCVDLASPGDVVTVPAGSATWTTFTPNKGVRLVGAGIGSTNITLSGSPSLTSAASNIQISGFTFTQTTSSRWLCNTCTNFRIYSNRFIQGTEGNVSWELWGSTASPVEGLFDHNIFDGGYILYYGSVTVGDQGSSRWAEATNAGTSHAVYIEDNQFILSPAGATAQKVALDSNRGGREVFRFNSLVCSRLEQHGLQSEGFRGTRLWEFYGNTFLNTSCSAYESMFIRAGTGFAFHNTTDAGFLHNQIDIDGPRQEAFYLSAPGTWVDYGLCDGNSSIDGNTATLEGALCRDQIGAGRDASVWNLFAPGPAQTAEPVYIWRNTRTDTSAELPIVGRCADGSANGIIVCNRQNTKQIVADRNFYIYSALSTSTQTTGVREGTAAAMAAVTTCTQGVGFWVTNEGSWNTSASNPYGVNAAGADGQLYVCGASNNWVLKYTPYTYPHPLQGAATPPAPDTLGTAWLAAFHGNTFAVFIWPRSTDANHKAYNIYRCTQSGACANLVKTITPASAAAAHSPETQWIDSSLYVAGTYYYSVSDVNLSDYVGPASTAVGIAVTGKQ